MFELVGPFRVFRALTVEIIYGSQGITVLGEGGHSNTLPQYAPQGSRGDGQLLP